MRASTGAFIGVTSCILLITVPVVVEKVNAPMKNDAVPISISVIYFMRGFLSLAPVSVYIRYTIYGTGSRFAYLPPLALLLFF